MLPESAPADICLILEGTYPYVAGGVSSWTHELIRMQSHMTFSLVTLVCAEMPTDMVYELPSNVVSLKTIRLQDLPEGEKLTSTEEKVLFTDLEASLRKLQSRAHIGDLSNVITSLSPWRTRLGRKNLLDSPAAWEMLLRIYESTMPKTSFLDYFWSWRGLFGGLFSVLLADLPKAKAYHSMCTGYAGLMLARAHLETGMPCIVTEHGIYTNERRIEIASADWINDPNGFNLAIASKDQERDLKDLWIDTFGNYSRFCYEAASEIITLYGGNQEFQRMDGADPKKLRIIPNGVDFEYYSAVRRKPKHPPTVALIGRVVPIKDIKTYIKAVHTLKQSIPDLRAFVMGPENEDAEYVKECFELAEHLQLEGTLVFTGKVNIREYLPEIDIVVLTSISEAQPLVVLEAGAAGIPTVATDVGACREMILGAVGEKTRLDGGVVVNLGSPLAVATGMLRLLTDEKFYKQCSRTIKTRVQKHYSKADQRQSYADLYESFVGPKGTLESEVILQDNAA